MIYTAQELRDTAKVNDIVFEEMQAIELAIQTQKNLFKSEAYVSNSTMTDTTVSSFNTFSQATEVTGTVLNPTVTIGDKITINTIVVTFTGTNLSSIISDINNASTGITASNSSNYLKLSNAAGQAIIIADGSPSSINKLGFTAGTYQSDIITNDRLKVTTHGYVTGDPIQFTTSGTLPAPLSVNGTYYVIRIDNDYFRIASSVVDANSNNYISITSVGSGTHNVRKLISSQLYYKVWQDLITDNYKTIEMNILISYFENKGFKIVRQQNPVSLSVFRWKITW